GRRCTIGKRFTASLHTKSRLAEFLGKWRGRPVVPGETIDLSKLIGASCTLVVSHQLDLSGQPYGAIDAISKPTKKVTPSGQYDPAAARQRIAQAGLASKSASPNRGVTPTPSAAAPARAMTPATPAAESKRQAEPAPQFGEVKSNAAAAPQATTSAPGASSTGQVAEYDPEVGF
ncbi:MAG: hypothetical protein ACXWDN_12175, partial [Limisphaerales bacterium]